MTDIQFFSINSQADELPLSIAFAESANPAGILQCCHGMCEHKERYIPFMKFMSENGFHCIIHDMRGHGKSIRSSEDLGYFYRDGANACIEDLHTVNSYLHERYPDLPVFLFGHSMGSLEVRTYCKKYDNTISGLIVCGCPSPVAASAIGRQLVNLVTVFKGEYHRSSFLNKMVMGAYNKPYVNESKSEHNWLSENKDNVRDYDKNPLCGFTFTLNGFAVLMDFMIETYNGRNWDLRNPELPVFFISGEDDPCRGSNTAYRKALDCMNKAGYKNVDFRLYPNMRHELLNEKKADCVRRDILKLLREWL